MIPALVLAAAVTISGECGPLGKGCEQAVAATMANRLASPLYPDDLDGVLRAYYGSAPVTPEALGWAMLLVARPRSLADGRYYYVYSDADCACMGWAKGDVVIGGAGLRLHLSGKWPGGE